MALGGFAVGGAGQNADTGVAPDIPELRPPPGSGIPFGGGPTYDNPGRGSRSYPPPPIYFPPLPPPLDLPFDPGKPGPRPPPAALAAYVGEPFYAPLSSRLATDKLKTRLRERVEAYRAAEVALQDELRDRLRALAPAAPADRRRGLAAFAAGQAPRIAALEAEAERLRTDLVMGGPFEESSNWNAHREWQLGVSGFRTPAAALLAQFQVLRAAIFYQEGLSPEQRRLLREVLVDFGEVTSTMDENGDIPPPPARSPDANPLFSFSPETARFRLPSGLPADLARKISEYERQKADLKEELRSAVCEQDRARFEFLRRRALERLADEQAPRFAALEAQAEEIRIGLAALPSVLPRPPSPDVPPTLAARMAALLEDKKAAERDVAGLLQQVEGLVTVTGLGATSLADGHARLNLSVSRRDRTPEKLEAVRAMIARYNADGAARLDAMERERNAIHAEMARYLRVAAGSDGEKEVAERLDETYDAIDRQQYWDLYQDCRTATLEPGLSPAQRRLLFGAGLERLGLHLPGPARLPLGGGG